MVEKGKDPKKESITEEDTATLLQRYSAQTVLALLQEVAHSSEVNIDWNRLVANTSTGISNAREYQMLWRYLAYRESLLDKFDDGAQPLDDDSDLEYELETFPAVSGDATTEAAACVKVLIASGLPSDSSQRNGATVEAPLTINIPNGHSSRTHQNSEPTCSLQGMNITVPVSVQKQPLSVATTSTVATADGGDANGLANNSNQRKKRKKWSDAEDLELYAAVQKCGEGNWSTIMRGDFKGDRTANQLAQRWKHIRKKHQDLSVGGNSNGELSEAQLAARYSLSVALLEETKARRKFGGTNAARNSVLTTAGGERQSQQGLNPAKPYQMGLVGSTTKSQVTSQKTLPKPISNNDDMVRAAAVAAGARIATPDDAASLLKAAQAKNAVHIMPTGGSSVHSELQSNVHHMRSGLATTPLPTSVTPSATYPGPLKAHPQINQQTSTNDKLLSKQIKGVSCSVDAELSSTQEVRTAEVSKLAEPVCAPTEQVQDGAVISTNGHDGQVQEDKVDSPDQKAELKDLLTNIENPVGSKSIERREIDNKAVIGVQAEERQSAEDKLISCSLANVGGGDLSVVNSCEKRSASEKHADVQSIVTVGCKGKQILSEEQAGIKI